MSVIRSSSRVLGAEQGSRDLGWTHHFFQQSLDIAQRLANAEPDRADYQRDLSISYERLAASASSSGATAEAAARISDAVEIRATLRSREPNRVDLVEEFAITLTQRISLTGEVEPSRALAPFELRGILTMKGTGALTWLRELDTPEES